MESVIERTKDIVFDFNTDIPEKYQQEIKKACYLLKNEGVKKIYLFGSMVTGKIHAFSDIDIGIKGLPPERFLRVYSYLSDNIGVKFDLVDFDFSTDFFDLLKRLDEVKEIG
jgi:predicted nucleotidyltransferase